MASKFKKVTIEEVTELKEAAENLSTQKSTITRGRDFEKWRDENKLERYLEMILPEQLHEVLNRFYVFVCKQDGTDCECGSLKQIIQPLSPENGGQKVEGQGSSKIQNNNNNWPSARTKH